MEKVTDTIINVGVNDYDIDLFEGQYDLDEGMAYNSYVIMDDKIAILDTVDSDVTEEWMKNLKKTLINCGLGTVLGEAQNCPPSVLGNYYEFKAPRGLPFSFAQPTKKIAL